jgi:futalosine hydrolase
MELAPLDDGVVYGERNPALLVTGVGMVATAAQVARALAPIPPQVSEGRPRYDVALNLGLCGSFDPALPPGTVVHVVSDQLPELGAEDGEGFLTLRELGLDGDLEIVNAAPPASEALRALPAVRGITVNTVHGRERSIDEIVRRCRPQVESMEGAAFMYACRLSGVPFAQVRAVSNVVERRNREAWRIEDAVRSLCATARTIVESL